MGCKQSLEEAYPPVSPTHGRSLSGGHSWGQRDPTSNISLGEAAPKQPIMSHVTNIMHIVLSTKHRKHSINFKNERALYTYIYKFNESHNLYTHRINGMPDHVHILVDLSNKIFISDYIRDLKREANKWIKSSGLFPDFESWGKEYFAVGRSKEECKSVIDYIKNQKNHHIDISLIEELKEFYRQEGYEWTKYDDIGE